MGASLHGLIRAYLSDSTAYNVVVPFDKGFTIRNVKGVNILVISLTFTLFGPRPDKTCLRGYQQNETQTSLFA